MKSIAKQVWRIIVNPNSLVTKIFKARYFKHSDIMEASIGSNPSFIWRSLCWGRNVLNNGLLWKVGTRANIRARKDAWIPGIASRRFSSSISFDSNTQVDKLILPHNQWDIQKLKNIFLPFEVEAIKHIPIPRNKPDDSRYWRFEKKRLYTVKLGYKIYFTFDGKGSSSQPNTSSPHSSHWWKKIWKLNIPHKVKIFVWKVSHDIIAIKSNLHVHHVPCESRCALCGFN